MNLDSLISFLADHQSLTLVVLFFGSYFETLIGASFFVYGEIFFLAGAMLTGAGQISLLSVCLVLFAGGIIGDHSSYWIGRRWGKKLYDTLGTKPFFRRHFTPEQFERGSSFFAKYGGWSVFAGRFLGAVSWITPFLAGIFKLPYKRFTLFDFPAVILGIGQFIVVGYLFGRNYQTVFDIISRYFLSVVFIVFCLAILYYLNRRQLRRLEMNIRQALLHYLSYVRHHTKHAFRTTIKILFALGLLLGALYSIALTIFFLYLNHPSNEILPLDIHHTYTSTKEIVASLTTNTYYEEGTHNVGPINLILVTNHPLSDIMRSLGWTLTASFIRDQITLTSYLTKAWHGQLPVSDLYFEGVPQNSAYEYGTNVFFQREHVRFWKAGTVHNTPVYLATVSKDRGFDFYNYRSFFMILHSLEPSIDTSRTFLVNQFHRSYPRATIALLPSPQGAVAQLPPDQDQDNQLFFTDGKVAVINLP